MKSNIRACSKSCRLFFVRYLMVDLLPIPSMLPINYLYWIFKPLLKLSWRTAYSIKITGKENIDLKKPTLIVANHTNAVIDPIAIAANVKRGVFFLARGDALRLGATPAVVHLITGVAAPAPGLSGVLPQYRFGHASQSGEDLGIIVGGRQMRYTMCLFRLRCCGRRVLGHPTRRGRYSLILRLLERRWSGPPVAPAARWESGPVPAIERPRLSAPQSAASDALTGPQAHVWCSRVLSR